jgi:hypothetical protein
MLGEVGVVTIKEKIQVKLSNRGITCMFVVYTEHHSRDLYRNLNLTTNSIINSCDIIWLMNGRTPKQQYPLFKKKQ